MDALEYVIMAGLDVLGHPPQGVSPLNPKSLHLNTPRNQNLAYIRQSGPKFVATWNREFKLPWREAGPPNHHDDKVDSDQ